MRAAVRGLEAARSATVQVCDQLGTHHGQGLLLELQGEGTIVLTCHHVITSLGRDDICVRILQDDGQLGDPIVAQYDAQRSRAQMDAVVLRVPDVKVAERPRPLLHILNPKRYAGVLDGIGLTYLAPDTFDARVGPATRLEIPVQTTGDRSDLPERYVIPVAYRLSYTSDARPGISGGVILCEDGVLGLAHFARGARPDQEREVYLVPLTVWAEGWSALANLLEPLIDKRLWGAARIKRMSALEIGTDIVIARYKSDLYIERKEEEQARAALKQRGSVVIVGRPKSGKTRLAWLFLQERPDALVIIPRSDRPPDIFEASSLIGNELVVFFDDLHRTAETSRVLAWRERLEDESGQKCLLIITTRDGQDWKRVKEQQASLLQTLGRDTYIYVSRVDDQGKDQGKDLSIEQGRQLAQALGMDNQEFDRRFDGTPGSLTLDLEDMRERYVRMYDEERAGISMSRLLDSAKLLHTARQPSLRGALLKPVAEQIRGEGRIIGAETWERLRNRTLEEGFGHFDSTNDVFQTYRPYLEECVTYNPSTEEVEALLPILINVKDYDGLHYLGSTLHEKHRLSLAERACRVSIDGGNKSAYVVLGEVLAEQPGREADAEQAYRQAIDAGIDTAYNFLGNLLAEQPGREADAEQAYRQAIDSGEDIAYANIGNLLAEQPGREADAEQSYRQAIDAGLGFVNVNLGDFLSKQPGREADAEQAYRQAIDKTGGSFQLVYLSLGNLLADQPGREADAEQAYREVINSDDMFVSAMAYIQLGLLLCKQPGREADAEQACRRAIELDDELGGQFDLNLLGLDQVYLQLGNLLADQPGREADAEQAYRQAIDLGSEEVKTKASFSLGMLVAEQPGREADAEQAFKQAIDLGSEGTKAWSSLQLGMLLSEQPGREADAEQAFKQAINLGSEEAKTKAWSFLYLGMLLSEQLGREAEVEQAYLQAIDLGDQLIKAWSYLCLSYLFANQSGREAEAEEACRRAIDLGSEEVKASSSLQLGNLLAEQPGREAEAEQAYRQAINAGRAEAYNSLGNLLAKQPGREAEAKQFLEYTE